MLQNHSALCHNTGYCKEHPYAAVGDMTALTNSCMLRCVRVGSLHSVTCVGIVAICRIPLHALLIVAMPRCTLISLNFRTLMILALVTSTYMLVGMPARAAALGTGGLVQVSFNSGEITQSYPQAYAFGVTATASPGALIDNLTYQFGDGSSKVSVYCCQAQVSEVQYHIYSEPGTYTVTVTAYDNAGNSGSVQKLVNWPNGLNGQQSEPAISQAQVIGYGSLKSTSQESLRAVTTDSHDLAASPIQSTFIEVKME